MSTVPNQFLTPEQYLQIERRASIKSEYRQGEMFAMAGASKEHNLAVGNIITSLNVQLKDSDCEVYPSVMRIVVDAAGLYSYADVSVACGDSQFLDDEFDTLLNPLVIFEVLSKSTESYDRGEKFEQYRQISTLQDYVLMAQDRIHIEHYQKQSGGGWTLHEYGNAEDVFELGSIGCKLRLSDLYQKIKFPVKSSD